MTKRCRRHHCPHDQATQVRDLAVCDLCGREVDAWNLDTVDVVEFELGED